MRHFPEPPRRPPLTGYGPLLVVVFGLLAGCLPTPAPQPEPDRNEQNNRTLLRWLTCIECTGDQLANTIRIDPPPIDQLEYALVNGPTDALEAEYRDQLFEQYAKIIEYRGGAIDAPAQDPKAQDFVQHYIGNFRRLYQSRSAEGLLEIAKERADLRDLIVLSLARGWCAAETGPTADKNTAAYIRDTLESLGKAPPLDCPVQPGDVIPDLGESERSR